MPSASMTMTGPGAFQGAISLDHWETSSIELVDVNDGLVSKVRISVEQDRLQTSLHIHGMQHQETERGPLEGRTVIGTRGWDNWQFELETGTADADIREALSTLAQTFSFDPQLMYPEGRFAPGQKWELDPDTLGPMMGGPIRGPSGYGSMHFVRTVRYAGEVSAEILVAASVRGTIDFGGDAVTVETDLEGTIYRSLESHIDLNSNLSGTMRIRGSTTVEGMPMTISVNGPVTVTNSTTHNRL
jgi:hypothetical protein